MAAAKARLKASTSRIRERITQFASRPHWPFQSTSDMPLVSRPAVSTSTRTAFVTSKSSGRSRYITGTTSCAGATSSPQSWYTPM